MTDAIKFEGGIKVSIHAPARGATGVSLLTKQGVTVSIHAPARGATLSHIEEILS